MPPKKVARKRPVDTEWKTSERTRAALVAANQSMEQAMVLLRTLPAASLALTPVFRNLIGANAAAFAADVARATVEAELPTLPADCWRVIMELALGQRTMSTFGAKGVVIPSYDYYGNFGLGYASIRDLRLVSRTWNTIASSLVRRLFFDNGASKNVRHPLSIAQLFPNASIIHYKANKCPAYSNHVKMMASMMTAQWRKRYPDSERNILVKSSFGRNLYLRVVQARDGRCVRHLIVTGDLPGNITLNDADEFQFRNWRLFLSCYKQTMDAGGLTGNRVVFVYDREWLPSALQTAHKAAEELNAKKIDLHLIIEYKVTDSYSLERLQESGAFANVSFHTTAFHEPSLSACDNVYTDAMKYNSLFATSCLVTPLIK